MNMEKNKKCKIIQDLLPSYIDKVTSDETNKFIEDHLQNCEKCSQILKDMNANIFLENIDEKRKINYLKKIKLKIRMTIIAILLIMTIIIVTIIKFFTSLGGITVNENGDLEIIPTFIDWITGKNNIKTTEVTNMLVKTVTKREGKSNLETITILTFDNNNKCIGERDIIKGLTLEELNERYNEYTSIETEELKSFTNVRIENDKLIYSLNRWNDSNKEELKKIYTNYTDEMTEITVLEF